MFHEPLLFSSLVGSEFGGSMLASRNQLGQLHKKASIWSEGYHSIFGKKNQIFVGCDNSLHCCDALYIFFSFIEKSSLTYCVLREALLHYIFNTKIREPTFSYPSFFIHIVFSICCSAPFNRLILSIHPSIEFFEISNRHCPWQDGAFKQRNLRQYTVSYFLHVCLCCCD